MFKKILKNIIWLGMGEGVYNGLLLVLVIFLARYLGAEDYGKMNFALSFTALFIVLTDFGMSTLAIREVAKEATRAREYLRRIIPLKLILSLLSFGLIFVISYFWGREREINLAVYLAFIYVVFLSFYNFLTALCRAFELMKYDAVSKMVQGIALFILVILGIFFRQGLMFFLESYILAAAVSLVVVWGLLRRTLHPASPNPLPASPQTGEGAERGRWALLARSWPFAFSAIFITIYYNIDSVMLGIMKGNAEVGFYAAAYKIIFLFITLRELILRALYPYFSKFFHAGMKMELGRAVWQFEKIGIFLAWPLALGIMVLAPRIINLLYGSEYLVSSTLALRVLIWAVAIVFIGLVIPALLLAGNEEKYYMKIISLGTGLNIILNLFLIPRYGLLGAGLATVAAELVIFILGYLKARKMVEMKIWNFLPKVLLAAIIMVFVIFIWSGLNLFLILGIGIVIYFLMIYFLSYFKREEIDFLKKFVRM